MIAQILLSQLIKNRKNNLVNKIINKIMMILRNLYIKLNDSSLVKYNLHDFNILLPFRHDLPIIIKQFQYYDTAIGRIPAYLIQKYSNFQAVDIGANVGDTATIIRSKTNIPILCIEGDIFYYKLLIENSKCIKNLDCENCFVGESDLQNLQIISYKGSARLTKDESLDARIKLQSLTEIISRYPLYNKVKFLKIDTDGFDCKIIRSNIEFLEKHKPIVYFEYDPYFLRKTGDDGLSVFNTLLELGYNNLLLYNNVGELLIGLETSNENALKEIHLFFSGRKSSMYLDICAFHKDDSDLYKMVREKENEFFQKMILEQNKSKHF